MESVASAAPIETVVIGTAGQLVDPVATPQDQAAVVAKRLFKERGAD